MDYSKTHEWELCAIHMTALQKEDYEMCLAIQKEIDKRIENGTINKALMQGFRYYNPKTRQFEGEPKLKGLNGLLDKYDFSK